MPVSTESSISGPYIPNGATTDFAFDFKATAADEVVALDQDGVAIPSALYSVTLDNDEGGTLSFAVAPILADYAQIYVVGDPALTQPSDFDNTGPSYNPEALTRALDRAAARDQKQQLVLDRTLRVPFGETPLALPDAGSRANGFLAFDVLGNPVRSAGTGADAGLRTDLAEPGGGALLRLSDGSTAQEKIDELSTGQDEISSAQQFTDATIAQNNLLSSAVRYTVGRSEFRQAAKRGEFSAASIYREAGAVATRADVVDDGSGGAPAVDADGKLLIARGTTNVVQNPTFTGFTAGVIGSGGALGSGWFVDGSGPTYEVISVVDGRLRIKVSSAGSPGGTVFGIVGGNYSFPTMSRTGLAASSLVKVISSSGAFNFVECWLQTTTSPPGSWVTAGTTADISAIGEDFRISTGAPTPPAGHALARLRFRVQLTANSPFSVTFEIDEPQVETGYNADDFTPFVNGTRAAVPQLLTASVSHDALMIGEGGGQWFTANGNTSLTHTGRKFIAADAVAAVEGSLTWQEKNDFVAANFPLRTTNQTIAVNSGQFFYNGKRRISHAIDAPHSYKVADNRSDYTIHEARQGDNDPVKGTVGITDRAESFYTDDNTDGLVATAGTAFWGSFSFAVRYDVVPTAWVILHQMASVEDVGDVGRSPPLAFELEGRNFKIITRHDAAASSTTTSPNPVTRAIFENLTASGLDEEPIWHTLVYKVVFGWNNDAELKVWLDGNVLTDLTGVSIGYNDAVGPYPKAGIYRAAKHADETPVTETIQVLIANPEFNPDGTELDERASDPLPIA